MSKPVVAAQLYTVRESCKTIEGIAESLKKVADIGYTAVQISGFGPADPKEVAKIAADLGLNVASTHMNWKRFVEDIDGVIEEHKLYDCTHPAIGGLFGDQWAGRQGIDTFLDQLPPVAEKLAQAGMDFSYHNHSHEFVKIDGKTWLETLYDEAGPEILKAEIDTYWVQHGGGDPVWWVRKCAGREPILHLKDMAITSEREQRMAAVGEGNLNWQAILDAAEKSGVEFACVEQDHHYGADPFENLAISYRNLKAMGLS